ncbi:DUF2515 family protein [Pontibacillus salicampi]|uniref:DUF2515 family protein n=1 Tax=Pontibacillus salicampi TaxID=1449801 RepID=A0ABV6LUE9_9BACI
MKKKELKSLLNHLQHIQLTSSFLPDHHNDLSSHEQHILSSIQAETNKHNHDNVTRTQAYYDYYIEHPVIHWALLAHLVSRNTGWNMSDLKGEYHSNLLSATDQRAFFDLLERGNWLIFQDAYPQLLLYKHSLQENTPYFHLLPFLHVSSFMTGVWKHFWEKQDSLLLTYGLIINEQHYIEKQLLQSKLVKQNVLETVEYKLQEMLNLTHILFPAISTEGDKATLYGQSVFQFSSLPHRIQLGIRLYNVLFANRKRHSNIMLFTEHRAHTGSRMDYWPDLFDDVKEFPPSKRTKLWNCHLKKGAAPIYSPPLEKAWNCTSHEPAETDDWFKEYDIASYFSYNASIQQVHQTETHCHTLKKLELASLAKTTLQ